MIGHLLLFGSGLLLLGLTRPALGQDWPQFLGPTRNGVYSGTNIAKAWPADGPPVRWQHKVGEGFSGPVVVGTKLILFHRVADKETCTPRWKPTNQQTNFPFPTTGDIRRNPCAFSRTRDGLVMRSPASGQGAAEFPWRPPINPSVFAATPLAIDDYIFLSISYGRGAVLLQFDGKRLKEIWSGDDQLSNHYTTSV